MNQTTKIRKSEPASTEAVSFIDGMLVTADDLQAAMHYPLSVVQVLLRSYLGCGIVCGLEVTDPFAGKRPVAKPDCGPDPRWKVKIAPGVALGCDAYPIELCSEMELDLSPDPCGCPIDTPETRFIAVKRERASEPSPRGGCGCSCGGCGCSSCSGEPGQQCTRQRDHVLVEAFDSPPKGACMRKPKPPAELPGHCPPDDQVEDDEPVGLCQCLGKCSDCDRCAEPWVVIAVLKIDENGIVDGSIGDRKLVEEEGGPVRIKPIECLCSFDRLVSGRIEEFEKRIKELEDRDPGTKPPKTPRRAAAAGGQPA